jgi:zinc protease
MDEVRPIAEKYYGPIPRGADVVRRTGMAEPPQRAARRVILRSTRVRELRWSRQFLAPSRASGESRHADALEVLDVILGGGTTSRLYRALVLSKKIALSVDTWYDADTLGPSSFGVSARPKQGVGQAALEKAVEAEIRKLLDHGVTDNEVKDAKKRMLAAAIFSRDSLRRGANAIGSALTVGQTIKDVETWPEQIEKVTVAQVLAAARYVFRDKRSVTGLLLPQDKDGKKRKAGQRRKRGGNGK